ncbi:MAG: EamA family transporter [Candidatus Woesearchaeota archaeon]
MINKWAFGLMFLCTFLTSVAQFFYKKAAMQLSFSISGILFNMPLYIGAGLYILGALLMLVALRGGDLSSLYPVIATSFIWVTLLSAYLLHEHVSITKYIGIASIMAGISMIGYGSRGNNHGN